MKSRSSDTVFKLWTEANKRLWEGLATVMPATKPHRNAELWRDTYMSNLTVWENTIKQTLRAEATLLEQWIKQMAGEKSSPEALASWTRQMEGVLRHWLRSQTKIWDDCFEMLKNAEAGINPIWPQPKGATEPPPETIAAVPLQPAAEPTPPQPTEQTPEIHPQPTAAEPESTPLHDDLKTIKGIGPVLESKLNQYGIVNYQQLAQLSDDDRQRLETSVLRQTGRIRRDRWIEQAKEQHFQKYHEHL